MNAPHELVSWERKSYRLKARSPSQTRLCASVPGLADETRSPMGKPMGVQEKSQRTTQLPSANVLQILEPRQKAGAHHVPQQTDCANCIRVCPFNQKRGWHHDIVRYLIKSVPLLNPLFLWLHSVLRYDQPVSPNEVSSSQ